MTFQTLDQKVKNHPLHVWLHNRLEVMIFYSSCAPDVHQDFRGQEGKSELWQDSTIKLVSVQDYIPQSILV